MKLSLTRQPVNRPQLRQSVRTSGKRTYTEVVPFGGSARLDVVSYPTETDVAVAACAHIEAAARDAIATQGFFVIGVPGGSALKALKGLSGRKAALDWSKVYVTFINHKSSLKIDDPSSTTQRVKDFFGDAVGLPHGNIVAPLCSGDAEKDATDYIAKFKALAVKLKMAATEAGVPRIDLALIGVGSDGHIGSLYANKPATTNLDGPWVTTSIKTDGAASITLTLPVMNAAKEAVICCTGAKKADIVRDTLENLAEFGQNPVQLLKPVKLTWLLDEGSSSKLKLRAAMGDMTRTDVGAVNQYNAQRTAGKVDTSDPLERYCMDNPDADECRIMDD